MEVKNIEFSVSELCEGYYDRINGVFGLSEKLHIVPAYQYDTVSNFSRMDDVVRAVMNGLPFPTMYCVKSKGGTLELVDGQEILLSICRFVMEPYYFKDLSFKSLSKDEQEKILNYKFKAYVCDGTAKEIVGWLTSFNINGYAYSEQEILSKVYAGKWVYDAESYFCRPHCAAWHSARKYLAGDISRQDYLRMVLTWICDKEQCDVEDYMSAHMNDTGARELWSYFRDVIWWVRMTFPVDRAIMKGVPWGILYNKYSAKEYDRDELESMIQIKLRNCAKRDMKSVYEDVLAAA